MKTNNLTLVIFGASGDLTVRKLVPALYNLEKQNLLPQNFAVLGVSRTKFSDEEFQTKMKNGLIEFAKTKNDSPELIEKFITKLFYCAIDTKSEEGYVTLKKRLLEIDKQAQTNENFIYYLSTPPSLYEIISDNLGKQDLNNQTNGFKRIIVEKPFGYNLETSQKLNNHLLQIFEEDQIYRIDHYLGKETVQNILVTRFANNIFEPLWNRNYIHHVEITSAESIGVGSRGGYYDSSGALRDMIQNHLLQLVGLIAMEPPAMSDSNSIRNETMKVFQSLRPIKKDEIENYVIRGQYTASTIKGEHQNGYREEKGVPETSKTETYLAMKFFIDNWRWSDVPFYIRTGKCLPTRVTEAVIHFKPTPHHLFCQKESIRNLDNQLVIRIQPDEGVLLKFGMKVPGAGFNVQNVNMDFHYSDLSNTYLPTAYERLLLDAVQGDSTLYARGDAVEATWEFVEPILQAWKENQEMKIFGYPAGTWGPENADNLMDKGYHWRYPCKNLADDGIYCEL